MLAIFASLALTSCSDPDFVDLCTESLAKKIPKGAEISFTKKNVAKQGFSATVTLELTAVIKKKEADDKLTYYKGTCIVKGDRVSRAFLRPANS
jgi:hypothetical protein